MASPGWLDDMRSAQKTALVQDGKKKVHYMFKDGREMAEEYDIKTNDLLVRKWKKKTVLKGEGKWEFEVGEPFHPANLENETLRESASNPVVSRKDTKLSFQWRIRNLPYPIATYNVTVDKESRQIVVRTTNKKYFKRISIPDIDRANLPLDSSLLSIAHANNTLIISYKKPQEILDLEQTMFEELKKLKASKDGDVECNPS